MITKMMNLKEQIERRLASNQIYFAHFVTDEMMPEIRKDTSSDVIDLVLNEIETQIKKFVEAFPIDGDELTLMEGRIIDELPGEVAYLKALVDIKRIIKKGRK